MATAQQWRQLNSSDQRQQPYIRQRRSVGSFFMGTAATAATAAVSSAQRQQRCVSRKFLDGPKDRAGFNAVTRRPLSRCAALAESVCCAPVSRTPEWGTPRTRVLARRADLNAGPLPAHARFCQRCEGGVMQWQVVFIVAPHIFVGAAMVFNTNPSLWCECVLLPQVAGVSASSSVEDGESR